ncbi:helix-turn-helix transcriptional regulator [Bordetella trematum]|uniref:helix-turn-helix transcriptional regulator n=1 Tax=Bordetella trematum TaxID=123899 RepID=UPI001FB5BF3B|nr:AraC family transcriptional regulator [Bordetella trematum]
MSYPARPTVRRSTPLLSALRAQAGDSPTLPDLAALGGMSQFQLIRAFRRLTGLPPHAWMLDQRVIVAREWLRAGQPLAEIAQNLGFADQSHFQRVFKAHTAVTPGQYRA